MPRQITIEMSNGTTRTIVATEQEFTQFQTRMNNANRFFDLNPSPDIADYLNKDQIVNLYIITVP